LTAKPEDVIILPVEYPTFGAGCKSLPVVEPTSAQAYDPVKFRGRR